MATVAVARSDRAVVAQATSDRQLLRGFLERDRLFAAYALCDLDDREFRRTRWAIASSGSDPVAVGLEYSGLSPQPVFLITYETTEDAIREALDEVYRDGQIAAQPQLIRIEPLG